jgi:precorrin-6B methylase 2
MNRSNSVRCLIAACGLLLISSCVLVQAQEPSGYQPQVGQAGKDVVWVPTQQELVNRMMEMAKVTPQDYVIDLGSGDGRTVISAAKLGAQAMGIEYNPDMVELSKRNAAEAGVSQKATFVKADLFESDFSKATVITMFLLPDINLKLRPKLLNLKPGTRIVSNSFTMEEWQADQTVNLESGCTSWCTAYLWIIPSKVEGKWKLSDGELDITQKFQMVTGTINRGGKSATIIGRLNGNVISFRADQTDYEGQVDGNVISGSAKAEAGNSTWRAVKQ